MRRRFPYEFKTIENYLSSEKTNYWKQLIQIDGEVRKLYFYHHRNENGLIYREELIGKKTFERYKNRPDRLVYRSVTFSDKSFNRESGLTIKDNNFNQRELNIRKMTQKFEKGTHMPAHEQIRKTVFNIDLQKIYIHYHYADGMIFSEPEIHDRDKLRGDNTLGDMNDKESDIESKTQQRNAMILKMETDCL
jgi:hypothetical protein